MFLRTCGRQILILHSYRDGRSRVRHHQLGRIRAQDTQVEIELQWKELFRRYPTSNARVHELWEQTLTLWKQLPEPKPKPKPKPKHEAQVSQGLLHEGHKARPNRDCAGVTQLATTLLKLGREQDCLEEMDRLPAGDGWAQMNKAALLWRQGRAVEAFDAAMVGLARAPEILPALESLHRGRWARPDGYWQHYDGLWSDDGRRFLLQLWCLPLVKSRIARVREGQRPRRLIKDHSRGWVLERLRLVG